MGIAAPAGTPKAIVAKLHSEIAKILQTADAKDYLAGQGREGVGSSPEEFSAYIRQEFTKWAPVIRDAGIRGE
jgi:tripartite-type tricarboxylate transporter receptor subunit TctC